MGMSELPDYTTKGTVHIVANNQVLNIITGLADIHNTPFRLADPLNTAL